MTDRRDPDDRSLFKRSISRRGLLIGAAGAVGGLAVWRLAGGLGSAAPNDGLAAAFAEREAVDAWAPDPMAVPEGFRVVVIGAGIAGSTAAYFVRRALGDGVRIVVHEKNDRVGGRVRSTILAGGHIELGATLLHSSNRHLVGIARSAGLVPVPPHNRRTEDDGRLAIWSGDDFVFETAPSQWRTTARTFLRYGRAPLRARALVRAFVDDWTQIYALQAQGEAFDTPDALFERLGLRRFAAEASAEFFRARGLSDRFMDELVTAVSRVNYNQDARLNAFANAVSLTGAGWAGGALASIRGGNVQLCEHALRSAGAELRRGVRVAAIAHEPAPEGRPRYRVYRADGPGEAFDAVVVANPLEFADLDFPGVDLAPGADIRRAYQVTHATFVAGELDPAYFGRPPDATLPETVLTMENPEIPFSSIGRVGYAPELRQPIYKVFSREALDEALLARLFRTRGAVHSVRWDAYPVLQPMPEGPPFRLAPRLYYANAMESVVSTMETQAVAGCNAAALLRRDLA